MTISWYERLCGAFLRRQGGGIVGVVEVEEFLGGLRGSDATRHAYFRALRAYFNWRAERGGEPSPMARLRAPKVRMGGPRSLDAAGLRRVLAAAISRRDKGLMALLADTGVRLGEAVGLTWADVSAESSTIRVDGKTGPREVPISEFTRWALTGVDLPFRSRRRGRPPLTVNGAGQAVRRIMRRAGVEHGSAHLMRHTFGRLYWRNGGDVFSLQRIMGHSNMATTRIYVEMDTADLVRQHRRFSPIVRLLEAAAGG